jgi:hypothetical protein
LCGFGGASGARFTGGGAVVASGGWSSASYLPHDMGGGCGVASVVVWCLASPIRVRGVYLGFHLVVVETPPDGAAENALRPVGDGLPGRP